jgi:hypothetical protein
VLSFNLDADLRSVFSWNTKQIFVYVQAEFPTDDFHVNQVSIWDQIVVSKVGTLVSIVPAVDELTVTATSRTRRT